MVFTNRDIMFRKCDILFSNLFNLTDLGTLVWKKALPFNLTDKYFIFSQRSVALELLR